VQESGGKQPQTQLETVKPLLKYTVYKDESEDNPIHSLVRLHIVVSGILDRENLTALLRAIYDEKRKGPFKYHPDDPDFSIFAYNDQQRAASMNGNWVAMLDGGHGNSEPKITVADELLASLSQKPEKRFGLTEEQRQKLMYEVEGCQDANDAAARRRYANNLDKQAEVSNQGDEDCATKIRKRYHVSASNYSKIATEAIEKKWPGPPGPDDKTR